MTLEDILNKIYEAILSKDAVKLDEFVTSFTEKLNKALENIELGFDKESTAIEFLTAQEDKSSELAKLCLLLHTDNLETLNKLSLAMDIVDLRRQQGAFDIPTVNKYVLNSSLNQRRKELLFSNIPSPDFSFLFNDSLSVAPQAQYGKPKKSSKTYVNYPEGMLNQMRIAYWRVDPTSSVPYLNPMQKKRFKIRVSDNGQICRRVGEKQEKASAGSYLYAISPKGGLYGITNEDRKQGHVSLSYHHSTVRAGQDVLCAGHFEVNENSEIIGIDNGSGHYSPTSESFVFSVLWLYDSGIIKDNCIISLHDKALMGENKKITISQLISNPRFKDIVQTYRGYNPLTESTSTASSEEKIEVAEALGTVHSSMPTLSETSDLVTLSNVILKTSGNLLNSTGLTVKESNVLTDIVDATQKFVTNPNDENLKACAGLIEEVPASPRRNWQVLCGALMILAGIGSCIASMGLSTPASTAAISCGVLAIVGGVGVGSYSKQAHLKEKMKELRTEEKSPMKDDRYHSGDEYKSPINSK